MLYQSRHEALQSAEQFHEPQPAPPLSYGCHEINTVSTILLWVPVDKLSPGTNQHRRSFSKLKLNELARSIKKGGGNAVPLIVSPKPDGSGYSIISGERRWRAAQLADVHDLLCVVGEYSVDQATFIAAAENLQREDLNPIEEAFAYQDMLGTDLSHEKIAEEVGKSRGHISNYLRLLTLSLKVRDSIVNGDLTASQARPLCTLTSENKQCELAALAVKNKWSVKRISQEVAKVLEKLNEPISARMKEDADIRRLTDKVSETTGYPCVIRKTASGSWQMGFTMCSADEFDGMLARLGIKVDD